MNRPRRALGPSRLERTGALVLVVLVVLVYLALTHNFPFLGGPGGQVVRARFAQANEVNDSTPVRVGGVQVGSVQRLDPGPGYTTMLVMRLTQPGLVVHRDASARIAWRTLLGGSMAVDLDPGSPSAPALHGPIPLSATSSQVDWDQLNSLLAAPTNTELQRMFGGLRGALADPAGAGRTLDALAPALTTIGPAMNALRGQDIGDLPALVRSAGETAGALAANNSDLEGLVDGAQRTLAITASDHVALQEAIELSPPALASTQTTMTVLDTTLTRLDPLVARLRPAVRDLAPATAVLQPMLARASRVLDNTGPLLNVAPAALRGLGAAGTQGTPLLNGLSPTVNRLNAQLIPFLNTRDDDTHLKIYEGIGPTFSDIDSAASQFDGSSWFLHFDASAGVNSVSLPCDPGFNGAELLRCNAVNEVLGVLSGARRP
jgi:virulence factor Mce-like protein